MPATNFSSLKDLNNPFYFLKDAPSFETFGATLYLENGLYFKGNGFGKEKIGIGEVVFNTSITGLSRNHF